MNSPTSWHSLATGFGPDIREAFEESGLLFNIQVEPVYDREGNEISLIYTKLDRPSHPMVAFFEHPINGDRINIGIVSSKYEILQNETLSGLCELLVKTFKDNGKVDAHLSCVGPLFSGGGIFVNIFVETIDLFDDEADKVDCYLTILNGHTSKLAFHAIPTGHRIVCRNDLAWTFGGETKVSLRHSRGLSEHIYDTIVSQLGIDNDESLARANNASNLWSYSTKQIAQLLREIPMSTDDFIQVCGSVYYPEGFEATSKRSLTAFEELMDELTIRWVTETEERQFGKNAWSALNAITEHETHFRGGDSDSAMDRRAQRSCGLADGVTDKAIAELINFRS